MFSGKNVREVYDKVLEHEVKYPESMDTDLKDLIMQLTNDDPQKRLGLNNMSALKNHPYFKGIDFESIKKQF